MKQKSDVSFEQSLTELEKVVGQLETGNITLEEALKLYESGVLLNRRCEEELKVAEAKLNKLKELLNKDAGAFDAQEL
jgi:exodeoxyribonuclease VII small subunit